MKLIKNLSLSISLISQIKAATLPGRELLSSSPASNQAHSLDDDQISLTLSAAAASANDQQSMLNNLQYGNGNDNSNNNFKPLLPLSLNRQPQAESNNKKLSLNNANENDTLLSKFKTILTTSNSNPISQNSNDVNNTNINQTEQKTNHIETTSQPNNLLKTISENTSNNKIQTSTWSNKEIVSFQRLFRNFSTSISILESVDKSMIRPLELLDLGEQLGTIKSKSIEQLKNNELVGDYSQKPPANVRFSPGDELDKIKDESRLRSASSSFFRDSSRTLPAADPCSDQPNTFYLKETGECRPQLDCQSIYKHIVVDPKIIANGMGKQVRVGKYLYNNNNRSPNDAVKIAFIETKQNGRGQIVREEVTDRVSAGLENLLAFQGNKNILKVYGSCTEKVQPPKDSDSNLEEGNPSSRSSPTSNDEPVNQVDRTLIISDFCENGDLSRFIQGPTYKEFDVIDRVKLTISFLNTFKFLHNSPTGVRINCDMNALHRALTQFLVTRDFEVVLNDLDDIPVVSEDPKSPSRCEWGITNLLEKNSIDVNNKASLSLNFMAPEQVMSDGTFFEMYPTAKTRFDTEKVDIWKLPDMIMFLITKQLNTLQDSIQATQVLITMEETLKKCKNIDYKKRPAVGEIIDEFEKVLATLKVNKASLDLVQKLNRNNDNPISYGEFTDSELAKRIMGHDLEQF